MFVGTDAVMISVPIFVLAELVFQLFNDRVKRRRNGWRFVGGDKILGVLGPWPEFQSAGSPLWPSRSSRKWP